ncbi:MAG: hypothetical protein LH477_01385 [Nocardioides sp.]|nr:hypothetical protein [Nocardioides sp.]
MEQPGRTPARRPRGDAGAGALEYAGVLAVGATVIALVVTAVLAVAPDLDEKVACGVRSVLSQEGACAGQDDSPTSYEAGAPPGDGDYANASGGRGEVDPGRVGAGLDRVRDALGGGWAGVREGELRAIYDTLDGLNGPEVDALVAALTDDELRQLVDEMGDGWLGGGWDRDDRRLFWNLLAQKASRATLDRLAGFTEELRPGFGTVGGDSAREDPESVANQSGYAELDHDLFGADPGEPAVHPNDVRQGAIGDCWFIASMMAVAQTHPELIENAITANSNGSYTVTLYRDGEPVQYTLTPDMVLGPNGTSAFVDDPRRSETTELWPLLLEKAMAQHAGSYGDIEGDWPDRALDALTGRPTTTIDPGGDLPSVQELDRYLQDGGAVAMGSLFDKDGHPLYGRSPTDGGLVTGHAYYVQSVDTAAGTVTVVNPWGIADYPPITMSYEDFTQAFSRYHLNEVAP